MQRMIASVVVVLVALTHPVRATSASGAASQSAPAMSVAQSDVRQASQGRASVPAVAQPHHERLFIAVFDCSWKNASKGPSEPTTVRRIYLQLQDAEKQDRHLHAEYLVTDCAHNNWFASPDNGRSILDRRVAQMYQRLGAQSAQWLHQDPRASITLLNLGGSWGAMQAAEFSMEVARRGIRDDGSGANVSPVSDDVLVGAGQTAQAIALLDPVGTASPDLRLPASVISGIQFTALDEHRKAFKSVQLMGKGISADGRFAGIFVPGAHADVCGGYFRNGLATRTGNMLIDYINGLSDQPLLRKQPEPTDPRLDVIHHSEEEGT